MKLRVQGQSDLPDPAASGITDAILSLDPHDHPFLILSRSRDSFVQVAVTAPDTFRIESRADRRSPLLQTLRTNFSASEVIRILEAYRESDPAWDRGIEWRPFGTVTGWDRVSAAFAFAGIAMFIGAFLSRPDERFSLSRIAILIYLPSALIDLRKFRTMTARAKTRALSAIVLAALFALPWIWH